MTIKRRIRIALSLMMLLPFVLMLLAVGASRFGDGEGFHGEPRGKPGMFSAPARAFIAEFSRLLITAPDDLAQADRLARLGRGLGPGDSAGWSVWRAGRLVYQSPLAKESGHGETGFTWDFRFSDGSPGRLVFAAGHGGPGPWANLFLASLFAALLLGNGLLGWWVSAGVIRPLAGLREAARRIGEGDLEFSLAAARSDEFGALSGAFETMRVKLKASLGQQLREEQARKELIAHVSHDLRTPISVIRGYAEGLRDGVAASEEQRRRYLATILERADELERLIAQLFSYASQDLGGARSGQSGFDPRPTLEDLRGELALDFPACAISLDLPPGPVPRLALDPELLRRVLANLTQNTIRHGRREGPAVEWRLRRAGDRWELAVADNGQGVSPSDLDRIFEPFFQADRARTRGDGGGSGLGLAIVRKIMEGAGGTVRAEAAAGGGLAVILGFREEAAHG